MADVGHGSSMAVEWINTTALYGHSQDGAKIRCYRHQRCMLYDRTLRAVHKTLFVESNLVGRVNDLGVYKCHELLKCC